MDVPTMKMKVIRLLGATVSIDDTMSLPIPASPVKSEVYSSALLIDSINAALDAITVKIWKPSLAIIQGPLGHPEVSSRGLTLIGSSFGAVLPNGPIGTVQADLPSDLIDVESVWSTRVGAFLPKSVLRIGNKLENVWGNAWFLYPSGKITFIADLNSEERLTVFYSAYWTHVSEADEESDLSGNYTQLEPPNTCLEAISLFAASYCLLSQANQTAMIRQYDTKVDSGTPIQNPIKEMSQYMLQRYQVELDKLPKMDKGDVEGPMN